MLVGAPHPLHIVLRLPVQPRGGRLCIAEHCVSFATRSDYLQGTTAGQSCAYTGACAIAGFRHGQGVGRACALVRKKVSWASLAGCCWGWNSASKFQKLHATTVTLIRTSCGGSRVVLAPRASWICLHDDKMSSVTE